VAIFGVVAGSPTNPAGFASGLHVIGVIGAAAWAVALGLTWLTIPSRTAAT
jgi:hypothetical protein